MYVVDGTGQITHTQSMRIVQTRSSVQFGEKKPMDKARLKSMLKATRDMTRINREIWDFLPRLERHLRSPDTAPAATDATSTAAHVESLR
jgi:hypothetical protein